MNENGHTLATAVKVDNKALLDLVTSGDAAKLDPTQKLQYYKARCEAAGLDPRTAPFQFIKLNGKEVLYAKKEVTDQLANKNGIRAEILSQHTDQDIRTVVVRAIAKDGRQTDEIGCVPVKGLGGADLANAYMKAVTKAKRRAILSLCGLGMMDEAELDTVNAVEVAPIKVDKTTGEILEDKPKSTQEPTAADKLGMSGTTVFLPHEVRAFKMKNKGTEFWIFSPDGIAFKTENVEYASAARDAGKDENHISVTYERGEKGQGFFIKTMAVIGDAAEPEVAR
jgi:hypothetical protein